MPKVNVREARQNISKLLDAVLAGEEVIITRRGKPVARLQEITEEQGQERPRSFPSREGFRKTLPRAVRPSVEDVREVRDERG